MHRISKEGALAIALRSAARYRDMAEWMSKPTEFGQAPDLESAKWFAQQAEAHEKRARQIQASENTVYVYSPLMLEPGDEQYILS